MIRPAVLGAVLLSLAVPALAQSSSGTANIGPADTRSDIAPSLPDPGLGPDASPLAYLQAGQRAMLVGRNGEAQEALERAQTRLLDRSVPLFQTNTPSHNPAVLEISKALQALSTGDREAALRHIQAAMGVLTAAR